MRRYIFLTNIPTPYRTSFYNALAAQGLDFEVFYMRNIEADRNWNTDLSKLEHSYYIDNGFYKMLGRFHVHFNPKLIRKISKSKSEIIIGGSWNDLDVLMLVILKRLGFLKNVLHFWSEANYLTMGASQDNFLKKLIRKFVYHSSQGAQLSSGKMTEITLKKWGINVNGYIPLPNTIEEEAFTLSEEEIVERYNNPIPMFLMPVRLSEEIKGIVNFFKCIGNNNVARALFLIAGEGPDKEYIQNFINQQGLHDHIKLVGYCSTIEMVDLYKQANVLVLPSYSDPSPLSLIEALKMKLPILASNRCGNHFEAVEVNKNGFLLDPYDPETVKIAYENMLERRMDWEDMGMVSLNLYESKFKKDTVVQNFAESLKAFSASLDSIK